MSEIPMFPLGSVLFPYTPLPLRVFEPRYLTMIGQLLDEDDPQFGVVLIERGHEVGGGDRRSGFGTMARLVSVAADAQVLHTLAVGTARFTVEQWLDEAPYPRAEVTPLPELTWNDALTPLRTEAEAIVRRVLARTDSPWDADTELSEEPLAAAWQLAAIAPLGEYDQYTLLQSTTVGALLRQVIDLTLDAEALWTAE
ncbi:LON peptidase substrate-binding domain-containing protein [Microbacterium sp. CFBP9023]|uniref:LON peptidase substrate-binding domain-containing protein n=1 Tax=Microbacterium TaxID=33882 RepID=UPI00069EFAF4|nr:MULTISPECIES: LON peptidase substrate-binding domain-containing protein [unclassified Microbacterium]AKV85414.1 peptidase S16 [Microbacterium sp. CGR1]KRD52020.1 peptidase S16 [Microbacterium sp. Root280D1]MBC6494502.1 peptidase S16 [Microbacterium sp. 4-7]MDY0982629.1 LON peptidase substrate-binding domain-containing protein [Microbacterium sp. CFBP9023]CAH0152753.1 Lon protease 2 [Microbacterium sp. Bi98]